MKDAAFQDFHTDKKHDLEWFVHDGEPKKNSVYFEIRTVNKKTSERKSLICGYISREVAREMGEKLSHFGARRVRITEQNGRVHTFVNPAQVEEF